ncbi:MAG: hypothetical protein ABRQ39_19720 [Candidatus Eremiobacterota bacterium]
MKKHLFFFLICIISLTSAAFSITKEDIIKLTKAGTREEVIITHLRAQADLKLSAEDIKELKEAGVGEKVLNFILENNGDMTGFYRPPVIVIYDGWKYGERDWLFYPWIFHRPHGCHPAPPPSQERPPGPR